jgi:putative endonuclease
MPYVYFLQSQKNNKVYVGSTSKIPQDRLNEHNNGCNSWSSRNGPFKLIYYEKYVCLEDAIDRGKFYKSGFGKRIKKVIIEQL